ncbi:hypothetical protein ABVK25_005085 [Lepraria finkii]|uniref:Uncharacterized protein n=1 Tax=Lepraria finkii TaxID=1340010 RepID=A0ABR4BD51_9LECA
MALCSCCGAYKYISDILKSTHDYGYYCRKNRHQQEFAYRFNEYNPEDKQRVYPRFTQRIITVSSGKCFNYSMVGGPQNERDGNLSYEYTNGTFSGNFTIPGQIEAFNGTTYVYRGINTPQEAVLKRISMHMGVGPQISRPWRAIYLLQMSHYSKRCKPGAKRDVRIGSAWEVHFKEPGEVGANMAGFAIGVSTMARTNDQFKSIAWCLTSAFILK